MYALHLLEMFSHDADAEQVVLKGVMLRRKKTDSLDGKPLIDLPGRYVKTVPCEFDADEREFYTAVESKMEERLEKLMGNNKMNYTSVLVLLLRLRQGLCICICCFLFDR
jgi:SNF2 family DNA or RNA helicase